MSPEHIEALLAAAREDRAEQRIDQLLERLREAAREALELPSDHPLRQVTAWRLAKAEYDHGTPQAMIEALRPILDQDDPFEHYRAGLRAADPVTRHYWDHVGYGEPLILELWEAASRAWRRDGDPYLAAVGDLQRAWQFACRGEREALRDLVQHYGNLTPDTFGEGPHRHPRAPDAPTSVFHVQLDLARTALWSACWTRDDRLAWEAGELAEDAAEGAGLERLEEVWYLDPVLRASITFGDTVAPDTQAAWLGQLSRLSEPRRTVHLGLAHGLLARRAGEQTAKQHFLDAAHAAGQATIGPEWLADALAEAWRTDPEESLRQRGLQVVRDHGVTAFAAVLDPTRAADQAGKAAR